jgi:hypothetical protein
MTKTRMILMLAALAAAGLAARCADAPAAATAAMQGDAGRPSSARWVRSELYFGVGRADQPQDVRARAKEADWQAFLDREVTPRFPDGLTVLDAYGQWLDRRSDKPARLRTKVLVILHEDTPEKRAAIDAIRLAWKAQWHDQSVLLVSEGADVSF